MSKINKIFIYIRNGALLFELKLHMKKLIIRDTNARSYEQMRMTYNKLQKEFGDITCEVPEYADIKSKKNAVWMYWAQGYEKAPDLVKTCINSVQKNLKNKEIVILDDENIVKYIQLPKYIEQKYKKGIISHAHYADLIRIELLCKYGGLWLDSTVLCTTSDIPSEYFNGPVFMYKNMDLNRSAFQYSRTSNWLIYGDKNSKILSTTRNMLFAYWKKYDFTLDYFIFHLFISMCSRRYENEWNNMPTYNNHSPHAMMFELGNKFSRERWSQLLKMSPFHKLERHTDYSKTDGSIYQYILKEYGGSHGRK